MNVTRRFLALMLAAILGAVGTASAQPLGTFAWQLQPFCNVVTVTVTQQGAVYTMDGYDDQCGAGGRAPLVGLATPNPDGTIGIGWNAVASGRGLQIGARITLGTLSGTWSDSLDNAGTLAFGANTGGTQRPPPRAVVTIPPSFGLQTDGGFVARGNMLTGVIPESGTGTRMMWHPAKAAFRAGWVQGNAWDDAQIGQWSVAFGDSTRASGVASFASGGDSVASGDKSTALGESTASGVYSAALGRSTASGAYSTALGNSIASGSFSAAFNHSIASGYRSTGFGDGTTASGAASVAMGLSSFASGQSSLAGGQGGVARAQSSLAFGHAEALTNASGSFVWGDLSTSTRVQADQPGQFIVRAAGGARFATNPTQTTGVILFANASAWSSLSDVNSKALFRDLANEDILTKIANLPVREWSYKSQGAAVRHMGPTAQDFHAAFGLGEDPLRISTIDADGVALAGVKALDARTREANERLTREVAALREALAEMRRELAALSAK